MLTLIISIAVFIAAAYGLYWVCQKFAMPKPVWWVCGGILLLVLLVFLLRLAGLAVPPPLLR